MTDRSDVLAEHQQHRLAVGRRRRRIAAGGDERRADAVDLVPGVDHATAVWVRSAVMVVLPVAVMVPPVSLFAAIATPFGAESPTNTV